MTSSDCARCRRRLRSPPPCTYRFATEADEARIDEFFRRLSPRSNYLRFFSPSCNAHQLRGRLPKDARRSVVLAENGREVVAVGELVRLGSQASEAEVAFAVLDAWQHHGVASHLLALLADKARHDGVRLLTAQVLGVNELMMQVFRESGLPMTRHLDRGVYDVTLRCA